MVRYGGLDFEVASGVYEPYAEFLPTAQLAASAEPKVVIDLGCGSGAQGIWVARRTGAYVIGIDRLADAVEQSRENARRHGVAGEWHVGNLFDPVQVHGDVSINTLPYEPPEHYADVERDEVPPSTYIGDGSFGAALAWGTVYSDRMAVYGLRGFERAFALAGWAVERSISTVDTRHFLLRVS